MNKQTDKPNIKVTKYPEGVRFGAGTDLIMSSEVLETHYISREKATEVELSFEQQQHIDELGKKAYTPSSNSNKYRYELYAYIDEVMRQALTTNEEE